MQTFFINYCKLAHSLYKLVQSLCKLFTDRKNIGVQCLAWTREMEEKGSTW